MVYLNRLQLYKTLGHSIGSSTRWPCIQIVNSIAPYYVVDSFWMSVRGDRVGLGDASTPSTLQRVHGSQVLWTHPPWWTCSKSTSQLQQLGHRPTTPATDFLPPTEKIELRVHVDDLLSLTAAFHGRPTRYVHYPAA